VLMNISDMVIDTYLAESVLLRTQKMISLKSESECAAQIAIAQVYIHDAADRINKAGKEAINSFAEGDELMAMLMGIKRFTKTSPFNAKIARRVVADKMIEANEYCY